MKNQPRYRLIRSTTAIIFGLIILIYTGAFSEPAAPQQMITVSGTVTGPSGPVANVRINIGTENNWYTVYTNGSGQYAAVVDTNGEVWLYVRPAVTTRLTEKNRHRSGVSGNIIENFTVENGNILEFSLPVSSAWFELSPLSGTVPAGEWLALDYIQAEGKYRTVVPPDIYGVRVFHLPAGYFETYTTVDLRTSDHSAPLTLNTKYEHPIGYAAPEAAKITVGSPGDLGEAAVTGAPGAVLPLAHVMVVNLDTAHEQFTVSAADGSFSTTIFAPPGSTLMVKHGRPHRHWQNNLDPNAGSGPLQDLTLYPATLITLPHTHTAAPSAVPFATAGGANVNIHTPPFHVPAAWGLSGEMSTASTTPGQTIGVTSQMRLYSHAVNAGSNLGQINVAGWIGLTMLSDAEGNPVPVHNFHGSARLTPTGLPISHNDTATIWVGTQAVLTNPQYIGSHTIRGDVNVSFQVPADLPPGHYRPIIAFDFAGVPESSQWPASPVQWSNYETRFGVLPPLTVKSPSGTQPPETKRQVWALLMNNITNGQRGTLAREDQGHYQPASFIVTQGAPYIAPRREAVTGDPIAYRLEPFLPLISYSDRLNPAPPQIPFDLPGGQVCVTLTEPDSQVRNLGCHTIEQSVVQSPSTAAGQLMNNGSIQINDIYALTTGGDTLVTTFLKDGHHTIEMTGHVFDIWGNRYEGGGTYDVWVARPLDLDFGVLPGTPFDVDDAFNPALTLQPHVPADVTIEITHHPFSDPAQAVQHQFSGQANTFGYFNSNAQPFTFDAPGEYRVDVSAVYTDTQSGDVYRADARWGGVVMTPPAQADLVAHGRRGIDNLTYIPNQWFTTCGLSPPAPAGSVSHVLAPYLNGDVIWSRLESIECDGFALRLAASVQDTGGAIEARIIDRFNRAFRQLQPPGDIAARQAFDELPLFSSTSSGKPIQVHPEQADQIAYAYLSSQRPGVRVREVVAEDGFSSGYWRLDSTYDGQFGVGIEGDLPNDFKFQYIGTVFRDLAHNVVEYGGHGSGWVHLPDSDPTGSRVMPPFAGPGNGGWPTTGGPLMTLKGEDIHMFLLPTGVHTGQVLEVGDIFHFAGHLMPALPGQVRVKVTSPSNSERLIQGKANPVGYFYDPGADFAVDEAGLWTVDVTVWHDGKIGSGEQVNCSAADPFNPGLPCPAGDVLGSASGTYQVFVVEQDADPLRILAPATGRLAFPNDNLSPVAISGPIPAGLTNPTVDFVIRMPGFILHQGQAAISGGTFFFTFDPATLHANFPNLDLNGRADRVPGLSDTITISLLARGTLQGQPASRAGIILLQGQAVTVGDGSPAWGPETVFLPVLVR